MPIKKREELYELFTTGNKPTQDDFVDLIDSMINIAEDGIGISEKGRPMEIVEQGNNRRLLDFSSSRDTPIWRINAQSADGNRSGLNISSANRSRLFIRQDNGFTGINNDAPGAKLHITPDHGPALRVDDTTSKTSFVIDADGRIGIGTEIENDYRLSVDGKVCLKGETTMKSPVYAEDGIIVRGAKLHSEQGISVYNGASVETGQLEAKEGLTVTGALNANGGVVVNGLPLEAKKGLLVKEGATIESGVFRANAGLEVSGAPLTANNGVVVNGAPLNAQNGLVVSAGTASINGELVANKGLTVENSTFKANAQVILGNAENGPVTADGTFVAKEGIVLEKPTFQAVNGITISEGDLNVERDLIVSGQLLANNGIRVKDSVLEATGRVILGEVPNGEVTVNGDFTAANGLTVQAGTLYAQEGAVVSGAQLQAENGLLVKNGAIIENGLLTVNDGVSLGQTSEFNAYGQVNLGNRNNGTVTVNGELRVVNGGIISGENLQVDSGLLVNGFLNAPNESNLGTASIQTLNVDEINVTGSLGLTSIDLASLRAQDANVGKLNTEGDLNVYGRCKVVSDLVLAEGRIFVTYEGTETPKIKIKKGTVSAEPGHFDFSIDHDKQVTITYDDVSDLANFIYDWKKYQYTHPAVTKGFDFRRFGVGPGSLKDEEIALIPLTTALKEYRVPSNGLRIMYTGADDGTPQFVIQQKEDNSNTDQFDFIVQDLVLGIFCPPKQEDRTVNKLLTSWENWKSLNQDLAADFEIKQTGDVDWQLDDILEVQSLIPTGDVMREYRLGELIVRNTSNVQNQPRLIVTTATPSFGEEVRFDVSLDTLAIALGTVENTPQAVYAAWKDWVQRGNETYGFEIVETTANIPIEVIQQESLVLVDETQSRIETAGLIVTYVGDGADTAKLILQGGNDDSYSFVIDEQKKELTINYPLNVEERMITNLLTAWEDVTDKHGFAIYGLGDELFVSQAEAMENIIAEIKEFMPTTHGVDNIVIRYAGPGADSPGVIIQANNVDEFAVSVSEDKVLTIKYPQDRSGSIDDLVAYWDGLTPAQRDGFSLIKNEIGNALVEETRGELVVIDENRIFSQGIIKTNLVTIEGRLAFADSSIEISGISNSNDLAEDSDAFLSTQKAVKTYVDRGLALKADQVFVATELENVNAELMKKADQPFVANELDKKADQNFVVAELEKKANLQYVNGKLADVEVKLEEKADQNFVETELEKKADLEDVEAKLAEKANQEYVTGELAKKADQSELSNVAEELETKADLATMVTALANKVNLAASENLLVAQGANVTVDEISLSPERSGLLLVTITAFDYTTAGLFALDGTESLIKIGGEGLSDRQGDADTCNVYLDQGKVMLQNALSDDVTVKVIYLGT